MFARSGALLTDIVPPGELPRKTHGFSGGFAIRGRRIAQGGPAYEGGRRLPGVTVNVFDAASGALLDRHHVDVDDGSSTQALAFAGRALIVRLRHDGQSTSPGMLVAIDSRTGARLWTRDAVAPDGRVFGPGLIGLGSEVLVGTDRLDARTGELKQTYVIPGGTPADAFRQVTASGRRVAIANDGTSVHVFAADGTFSNTVVAPYELCDSFGETIGLSAQRLLATSDSYCGSGHAFVFGLR